MNLRERIENNLTILFLTTLLTGFLAGIGTYEAILRIAHLRVIPETPYEPDKNTESETSVTAETIYQDKQPEIGVHQLKFIELTAKSNHNPPRVNDRIYVEFTLQNVSEKPINLLGTYVAAYDPSGEEKSFAYGNKNMVLKPQEMIKTSGSLIVGIPGIWEIGPHYALGQQWNGEEYPGHWKFFQIVVVQ